MPNLSERQKTLLMLIVRDYIDSAQAVGSKRLGERYRLNLSSATIRNEMAALTEMGYLRQPHTSAGRVPTEEGYRCFVSEMMNNAELPESIRHTIARQFRQSRPQLDLWMTLAASVLAAQSQGVSVVAAPHAESTKFKRVELIATQGRQVLMVLVVVGGEVSQQILTLAEPISQERLSAAAARLNGLLANQTAQAVSSILPRPDPLDHDILLLIAQDMRRIAEASSGEIYTDGLTNVLGEPEFSESDEGRKTLKIFEERAALKNLLARTSANRDVGALQVLIGGEGEYDDLRQCSLVVARYGAPGMATGALGVLGPMRMAYSRTIPTVRFVADLLSALVSDTSDAAEG